MTIDFFGDDSQLLLQHIQEHFSHLKSAETRAIIKERHQGQDVGDLFLTVVLNVKMTESFMKVAAELLDMVETMEMAAMMGIKQRSNLVISIIRILSMDPMMKSQNLITRESHREKWRSILPQPNSDKNPK